MSIDEKDLQLFEAELGAVDTVIRCPSLRTTCSPSFTCETTTCSETVG
jgi:hypothetical protein